ncbi:xanthine dehydrogenase family protein molybdopterin-binding subunit, partial [Acidiphilium sp. PM]
LVLTRAEEQVDSGNRPGTFQHLRIGARRDGTLTAIELTSHGTAGVALGAGVGDFAGAVYRCPNLLTSHRDVFTNAGPGCAMRAPGNVPGAFAFEQAIDELAERLALDPVALRDRIDPSPVRREERRIGAARFGWAARHPPGSDRGPVKRGIGMAQSHWGAHVQINAACEVRVLRDGSVEVMSSVQDIGTGITTVLAQTVAEVLGLRAEDITVRIGDTIFPSGP